MCWAYKDLHSGRFPRAPLGEFGRRRKKVVDSGVMADIINSAMKCFNKTGKKIGMLTVLELVDKVTIKNKKHNRYRCVCDCGEEVIRLGSSLHGRKAGSCGCMNRRQNLVGQTFGKLTVIKKSETQPDSEKWKSTLWDCQCECGTTVKRSSSILKGKHFSSCGCALSRPKYEDREEFLWRRAYKVNVTIANERRSNDLSDISFERFKEVVSQPCSYCGKPYDKVWDDVSQKNGRKISNAQIKFIGLDRIDSGVSYQNFNVVPCCDRCNTAKMDLSLHEWLSFIKNTYDHLYLNGGINKLLKVKADCETSFFFPSTKKPTLGEG